MIWVNTIKEVQNRGEAFIRIGAFIRDYTISRGTGAHDSEAACKFIDRRSQSSAPVVCRLPDHCQNYPNAEFAT